MGIFQGDLIIKTAIELGLNDMRKNDWLIDDIFSDLLEDPDLVQKYGMKDIAACKDWFKNNEISIVMKDRPGDKDEFPCICISMGGSSEKEGEKRMGDLTTEIVDLIPRKIDKPMPYIVKPFVPDSYDSSTGLVAPPSSVDVTCVAPGMILVNPDTGAGAVIRGISGDGEIEIDADVDLEATRLGVLPQYQIYRARREGSFFQESYTVACHAVGPAQTIWLHSLVLTALLRYREGLLEARGFAESVVSSSDLAPNGAWSPPGADNISSRYITLSGQVENTWLKTPRRVIEVAKLDDISAECGFSGGIKILSQEAPKSVQDADNLWVTVDETEDEG
jgi:hypothetical protein